MYRLYISFVRFVPSISYILMTPCLILLWVFSVCKNTIDICVLIFHSKILLNSSVNTWDEQVFGEILRCFYMVFWFPASLWRSRFLSGIIFFSPKLFHKNFISSLVLKDIFTGNGALSWNFFSSLWRCYPAIVRLAFFPVQSPKSFFLYFYLGYV